MLVKIELSQFTGVAELSGAELEVLNRAMGKMSGIKERHLTDLGYILVEDPDAKLAFKAEVGNYGKLYPKTEFDFMYERQIEKEAAAATAKREAYAAAAIALITTSVPDEAPAKAKLIEVIEGDLYYQENVNIAKWVVTESEVSMTVVKNDVPTFTLTVKADGTFTRKSIK